jgi:hypothetical protein
MLPGAETGDGLPRAESVQFARCGSRPMHGGSGGGWCTRACGAANAGESDQYSRCLQIGADPPAVIVLPGQKKGRLQHVLLSAGCCAA